MKKYIMMAGAMVAMTGFLGYTIMGIGANNSVAYNDHMDKWAEEGNREAVICSMHYVDEGRDAKISACGDGYKYPLHNHGVSTEVGFLIVIPDATLFDIPKDKTLSELQESFNITIL